MTKVTKYKCFLLFAPLGLNTNLNLELIVLNFKKRNHHRYCQIAAGCALSKMAEQHTIKFCFLRVNCTEHMQICRNCYR